MIERSGGVPVEDTRDRLAELRRRLGELESMAQILEREVAEEGGVLDLQALSEAFNRIASAAGQKPILAALLKETSTITEGTLLLVEEEGGYRVREVAGLSIDTADRTVSAQDDPVLVSVRNREVLYFDAAVSDLPSWLEKIRGGGELAVVPLMIAGRAPAVLIARSAKAVPLPALQVLCQITGLILQNDALSRQLSRLEESGGAWEETGSAAAVEPAASSPAGEMEGLKEAPPLEPPGQATDPWKPEEEEPAAEPLPLDEMPTVEDALKAIREETPPEETPYETEREEDPTVPIEEPDAEPETWQEEPPVDEEKTEIRGEATEEPADFAASALPPEETAKEEEESAYEIDTASSLSADELGLSQEEFERLLGTASEDWQEKAESTRLEEEVEEGAGWEEAEAEERSREAAAPEALESGVSIGPEIPSPEEAEAEKPEEAGEEEPSKPPAELEEPALEPAVSEGPGEEEPAHTEARRFARLLATEIKLYNESEVEEGRARNDLYRRLKADIDRSREMYERRIRPSVRERKDFFHAEIVRVLAKGDLEAMGEDYPGEILSPAEAPE